MQTLLLSIKIRSTAQKVWETLWNDKTYTMWTKPFHEGSSLKGKLEIGERIHFLNPKGGGKVSIVQELKPAEFVVFKHIAIIRNGAELPHDEESKNWAGALEAYNIIDNGEGVMLEVTADMYKEYIESMSEKFSKALGIVKKLAEN